MQKESSTQTDSLEQLLEDIFEMWARRPDVLDLEWQERFNKLVVKKERAKALKVLRDPRRQEPI